MVKNLTPENICHLIVSDFEGAWDSVALNLSEIGRGNFMFARQAMNLLEFASILCESDSTKKSLPSLSDELKKIEPRYFTDLPGPCAKTKDFTLPNDGNVTGSLLL